jgi:hypothetical protein
MNTSIPAGLLLAALLGASLAAMADEDQRLPRVPLLPKYQQECGSCHVAYPPGLLPAPSWRRVMNGLPHHFGTDASLDSASVKALSSWLGAHAATGAAGRSEPPEDRISRSAWFGRTHEEVSAATWKRATVKSPANCGACHAQADQGDFNEDRVRIPR